MTYFAFLLRFVGVPLLVLAGLTLWDRRRGTRLPPALSHLPAGLVLLVHVVAAVVYTTPWDNYLVATGVWFYDRALVTGLTLGWVPIEEYTFFVVQTLLTGSWLLWLGRRLPPAAMLAPRRPGLRWAAMAAGGAFWAGAVAVLIADWRPGTYLGLAVGWLLPPILLQLAVGADLLWHRRRLVALALFGPIVYLSAADFLAIGSGTWTIDPGQSTGILLGGVLPIEEVIFFALTNTLIVFGMVLMMSAETATVRKSLGRTLRSGRFGN